MKKIHFFSMLAAATALALGTTSCSNDDDAPAKGTGEEAAVSIGIKAPVPSRAVTSDLDGAGDATEDKITNFTAFVVDGDGSLKSGYSADGGELTGAKAIAATTAAKKVYVVANGGDLTDITTETALLNYKADLNGTGTQSTVRWATGEVQLSSSDFTQISGEWIATKTVELTFIAARITLTIENGMTGYDASKTDGSLVLKKVAVLNARGESKLFGASLIPIYTPKKTYYEGLADNSFGYYPPASNFTMAEALLGDIIPAGNFSNTYYYYAFENDAVTAAAFPTIITIVAEFNNKTIYYPVHLTPYEKFGSGAISGALTRGNSYNINIKLTVDPTLGGGDPGGTPDPTKPIVDAKVIVKATLKPWVPVTLNKEF